MAGVRRTRGGLRKRPGRSGGGPGRAGGTGEPGAGGCRAAASTRGGRDRRLAGPRVSARHRAGSCLPENLRAVHDRPPLLFVAGTLAAADARSVAVIGSRRATATGIAAATEIAGHLADNGYTVVSGLAAGIDTAAHRAALGRKSRTVAVIGTGLRHAYPPQNAALQRTIASGGAVVSQFWPDSPPTPPELPDAQRGHVRAGAGNRDRRGVGHERGPHPGAACARAGPAVFLIRGQLLQRMGAGAGDTSGSARGRETRTTSRTTIERLTGHRRPRRITAMPIGRRAERAVRQLHVRSAATAPTYATVCFNLTRRLRPLLRVRP